MSSSEARCGPAGLAGLAGGARPRRDGGFATAEAAVVLPALVLFAMGLVWALLAAAAQIQCVDAARAGARAAARQDPPEVARAAAKQAAPDGARVAFRRDGDLVRVEVVADTPGPSALALHLHHEAVALAEETVGTSTADAAVLNRGARTARAARTARTMSPERTTGTPPPATSPSSPAPPS